jgi:hypothetical protein
MMHGQARRSATTNNNNNNNFEYPNLDHQIVEES